LRGNRRRSGAGRFFGSDPVADAVVDDCRTGGRSGLFGGDANYAGTGVLSALVGALLPVIVSFFKKPAVAV
jgi:hypothetical protein